MSELEDKLNSLLSNPAGMAQVVQLAQQLSGSMGSQQPQPPPSPPPESPPNAGGVGSLLGGLDMQTIARFLPMLQALTAAQAGRKHPPAVCSAAHTAPRPPASGARHAEPDPGEAASW